MLFYKTTKKKKKKIDMIDDYNLFNEVVKNNIRKIAAFQGWLHN